MSFILKVLNNRIVRYLISGGSAAVVDLGILYILVHVFHIWYLASAVVAFLAAFVVSFVLQKFFTFSHNSREGMHVQAVIYFAVAVANLGINTLLMYIFVDMVHVQYILAQIIVSAIIAVYSFFIYKHYIFHSRVSA